MTVPENVYFISTNIIWEVSKYFFMLQDRIGFGSTEYVPYVIT